MGRLNSLIKFVVVNTNVVLFLGGLGIVIVASLVLTADFTKLAEAYMQARGIFMVVVGVLIATMSIIGCLGTSRQITRDRVWSGRRILSLYQLILMAVIVGQGILQIGLYSIEVKLDEAAANLPEEHGEFEVRFRNGFNDAYFDQLCSARDGGDSWAWSLIRQYCPEGISQHACSCSTERPDDEYPPRCSDVETYAAEGCCPDEDMCEAGLDAACPYFACRTGILDALLAYITPARKYSTFVFVLEGVVLILTCLLICYNPRDSTEDILFKTGTLMRTTEGGLASGLELAHPHTAGAVGKDNKPSDGDTFGLELAQPPGAARVVGRESAAISTPAMSPIVAGVALSEPLHQFMTPRREGTNIVFTLDSTPGSPEEGDYEFENTGFVSAQLQGEVAAVGPRNKPIAAGGVLAALTLEKALGTPHAAVLAERKGSALGRDGSASEAPGEENAVEEDTKDDVDDAEVALASFPISLAALSLAVDGAEPHPPNVQKPTANFEGLRSEGSPAEQQQQQHPEFAVEPTGNGGFPAAVGAEGVTEGVNVSPLSPGSAELSTQPAGMLTGGAAAVDRTRLQAQTPTPTPTLGSASDTAASERQERLQHETHGQPEVTIPTADVTEVQKVGAASYSARPFLAQTPISSMHGAPQSTAAALSGPPSSTEEEQSLQPGEGPGVSLAAEALARPSNSSLPLPAMTPGTPASMGTLGGRPSPISAEPGVASSSSSLLAPDSTMSGAPNKVQEHAGVALAVHPQQHQAIAPPADHDDEEEEDDAPEPQSMFARFLLQAQGSLSRAQMALSLEKTSTPSPASPASPPHVSPLRFAEKREASGDDAASADDPPAEAVLPTEAEGVAGEKGEDVFPRGSSLEPESALPHTSSAHEDEKKPEAAATEAEMPTMTLETRALPSEAEGEASGDPPSAASPPHHADCSASSLTTPPPQPTNASPAEAVLSESAADVSLVTGPETATGASVVVGMMQQTPLASSGRTADNPHVLPATSTADVSLVTGEETTTGASGVLGLMQQTPLVSSPGTAPNVHGFSGHFSTDSESD